MMRLLLVVALGAAAVLPQNTDTAADLESEYIRMLSKWSGYREQAVRAWRQQVGAYTELAPMLLISRRANIPPGELIRQRDRGMTWGDIARDRKIRTIGTDFIDESNLFILAQHYRRSLEEVRAVRRADMSLLQLNEQLQRARKQTPAGP
ncbi:MAG TPA: hypothetical protein VFL57_21520 [Bryobacteraceae bacterium]|nr:hypothetical protein [Bryobacteraceae bacterium]